MTTLWYRVFGAAEEEPPPGTILERLNRLAGVAGEFGGDKAGWFCADLSVAGAAPLRLERFLASEEGIRAELNSWAAHVETCGDGPDVARLMGRLIQTRQLFTLARPTNTGETPLTDDICIALCRFLAETTDGVYQIDGQGVFAADGTLLMRDE